jgi:hypothetical protein
MNNINIVNPSKIIPERKLKSIPNEDYFVYNEKTLKVYDIRLSHFIIVGHYHFEQNKKNWKMKKI